MSRHAIQADSGVHMVFSVCADTRMTNAIMTVCSALPSTVYVGSFHEYISDDKKPQFSPQLKSAISCIALVDFDTDAELALKTVANLKQLFLRRISIIAVGSQLDSELMLRVMRAGCNEYLLTPIDNAELSASLLRFQSETLIDSQAATSRGRVAACVGAKGGVGATTLAVHLGMQLVKQYHQKTLLIDHKHELGHVALYLGLKDAQYHFDDLARNAERLDRDLLNGFVMRHASGLDIIASPDSCAPPHQSSPNQLSRILTFLRHEYDYVLIDSSIAYDDLKQCLIEEADDIFLVSTPDVAALRDLTRQLEYLGLSDAIKTKVKIIINRSIKDDDLSAHQIETAVGLPVAVVVPDTYQELVRAINHGEPISVQHRSAFARQISRLSSDLMKDNARLEDTGPKKKGFAFWR